MLLHASLFWYFARFFEIGFWFMGLGESYSLISCVVVLEVVALKWSGRSEVEFDSHFSLV